MINWPLLHVSDIKARGREGIALYNRVLKCNITNILIFEIMGFVSIFGKSMMKNAYLPKINILLQFGREKLVLLCRDDSIQILLILSQFSLELRQD